MSADKKRPAPVPGTNEIVPVLPLRDIVVFPHMIVPLFVGREKSIKALEEVMKSDRHILLATQFNATEDDPAEDQIYQIGSLATVLQLLKLPDGTVKVLVEGGQEVAEDVALLDAAEPVDGRAVEPHALLEGVLELGRRDGEALQRAEIWRVPGPAGGAAGNNDA